MRGRDLGFSRASLRAPTFSQMLIMGYVCGNYLSTLWQAVITMQGILILGSVVRVGLSRMCWIIFKQIRGGGLTRDVARIFLGGANFFGDIFGSPSDPFRTRQNQDQRFGSMQSSSWEGYSLNSLILATPSGLTSLEYL